MKIAVIGAGFGGLAAAYDLRNAGHNVTVFEAAPSVGGLASGFKEPHWDWWVERFYHHWFQTDKSMLGLIRELGWDHQVHFPRPYTVLLHNGRWYPFDSILKALLFPGLGFGLNKVRFGLVGLYLRLTANWKALEKYTADEWMRKWAGPAVYEKMWLPLLVGKFGPHHDQVNMAWMWARFKARTTRLGTFEGGFQAFADRFAERLRAQGVEFRLSARVQTVGPGADGKLSVESLAAESFDQVLVTTSPALLAKLSPQLPPGYLQGLLQLKSMGAVVMVLSLKHRLSEQGYYWFNLPKEAGYPFLALVEHTNFIPPEKFGGDHILYAGDYLDVDHEYFSLDDEQLLQRFMPAFHRFNPAFRADWITNVWVFRTNYAQPVPLVNHSANIPSIRTPLPGLYFASMSQVYPWDRGTNFAVQIGRQAAALMLEDGRSSHPETRG